MAVHSKSCFSATSDSGNRRNYLGGGGVYIPHSIAVISPYKAGKNLSVLPGVVIGKNGEGDRSKTNPTILDNVTIGAESVVAKDVSSNTIVAGNSAQVIKKYNFDKEIWEKTKED
jgi:serine acetyltransferase